MKKAILIVLIALVGCNKDNGQCSVCTVTITDDLTGTNSTTVKQTERHSESSGACDMSQDEFKKELEKETAQGVEVLTSQGIDATYSVNCVYE